jgi:hypothetical protein
VAVPAVTPRGKRIASVLVAMEIRTFITELYKEKTRLDRVIASLEQIAEDSSTIPFAVSRRGRKFMSLQERQQVSERMRNYWAGRKAAENVEPPRVMTAATAA